MDPKINRSDLRKIAACARYCWLRSKRRCSSLRIAYRDALGELRQQPGLAEVEVGQDTLDALGEGVWYAIHYAVRAHFPLWMRREYTGQAPWLFSDGRVDGGVMA